MSCCHSESESLLPLTPPSNSQLVTSGRHMCQVRFTSEPLAHSVFAWLITVWRLAMSSARKPSSPPHSPGHFPVSEWACAVYCDGLLSGSLLCTPLIVWLPPIWCR